VGRRHGSASARPAYDSHVPADDESVDAKTRYRLSPKTLGVGTYAEVFRATNRLDGSEVALKRAKFGQDPRDRIKREIQAQRQLAHPNVMPILDHDPGFSWYTMPIALGTLDERRASLGEEDLVSILLNIADALEVAHQEELVHRDISPQNILALPGTSSGGVRWVVADWGMVRRPAHLASRPLTRSGQRMGTPGYDAPELDVDPRLATPAVDVYSLGRVAAWFTTGKRPTSGVELLPDGDMLHWRMFVYACSHADVDRRVQTMSGLRTLLEDVLNAKDEPVLSRAARLTEALILGEGEDLTAIVALAEAHPDNPSLFFDYLARVSTSKLAGWTRREPERASRLAALMARHLIQSPWQDRDPQYVGTPLGFVHTVLRSLIELRELGHAQDVASEFFRADLFWNHQGQRRRTMDWLADLDSPADRVIGRVLASNQDLPDYYKEPGWRPRSVILSTLLGNVQ
jgi:eukaryotic-like serine/threonine-protein kinase